MLSLDEQIENANKEAVEKMMESDPVWTEVGTAKDKIPGMKDYMLLHAGPPLDWANVGGAMKGAVMGGVIYEGWADTPEEAEKLVSSGHVVLDSTHHHDAVAPMAGLISPSMPVYVVYDKKYGNKVYTNFNEGIGKVLRHGAYNQEVIDRLTWISTVVAPLLGETVKSMMREKSEISLKDIIAQALMMGDDCHNRYNVTTILLLKEITPYMFETGFNKKDIKDVYRFLSGNSFTALNLGMAAAKAMTKAAHNIKYSTIVSVMSRNGFETGIWVSGLGNRWFTAPAPTPKGLYFPGYSESDANPDLGDSTITETAGFGAFSMAGAPAIVSWIGGKVQTLLETTVKMYDITYTEHKYFRIPYFDFRGTPTGIDIRKIIQTRMVPIINTGISHKVPGKGQIGAGITFIPFETFKKAYDEYLKTYGL